jgi:hypothetical protein
MVGKGGDFADVSAEGIGRDTVDQGMPAFLTGYFGRLLRKKG